MSAHGDARSDLSTAVDGGGSTLHCVLPGRRGWPLFDTAAARAIEAQALQHAAPHALMARAGLAVARVTLATQPRARRVHVLAGGGNNGGDGLVAATALHRQGLELAVSLLGDPAHGPVDARWALAEARAAGVNIATALPPEVDADVIIDALLGLGARDAPRGAVAEAIDRLGATAAPVIAVDIPSGLDGEHGTLPGPAAVRAAETVCLLTLKPGLFTAHGRDHAGRVWLDTLGVEPRAGSWRVLGAEEHDLAHRTAAHASHKGSFGDCTVVGGAPGMSGAATLAARAALAAGAGRVYLRALDPCTPLPDVLWPELMAAATAPVPTWPAAQTIVAGCGGGAAIAPELPTLLHHAARLVLDADAINAIAADPMLAALLERRGQRGVPTVITPHPLEAARLLGTTVAQVQDDRAGAALQLARRFGAVAVLKGSGTVIAAADGSLAINPTGDARLATPGSGDVLAGWLGGLWSRRRDLTAVTVASAAVWRHGLAAWHVDAQQTMRASELIDAMRRLA